MVGTRKPTSDPVVPNLPTLMTLPELAKVLRVSRQMILIRIEKGLMPKSIQFGKRARHLWSSDVIAEWIRDGCPPQRNGKHR